MSDEVARKYRPYLISWAVGLFVALVLTLSEPWLASTWWGRGIERYTIDFFQRGLSWSRRPESLPVVIVDIHDWLVDPKKGTSRVDLTSLLGQLAKGRPRAIGIDIDFSPTEEGPYVSPTEDPKFFKFCLTLKDVNGPDPNMRIPVFLGVGRAAGGPSFRWLGHAEYSSLAASIILPKDASTIPKSLPPAPDQNRTRPERPTPELDLFRELPSLGVALASVVRPDLAHSLERNWMRNWMTTPVLERSIVDVDGAKVAELDTLWVDMSAIPQLREQRINAPVGDYTIPSRDLERVARKAVLIGDSKVGNADDIFLVPGEEGLASGVYLHGAAAVTLIEKPLRAVTESASRYCLDFFVSVICISLVCGISFWRQAKGDIPLERSLTVMVIVGVMVSALVLLWFRRVLWLDAAFVILTNLLHRPAVRAMEWAFPALFHHVADLTKSEHA